jgi:hypothetical protein
MELSAGMDLVSEKGLAIVFECGCIRGKSLLVMIRHILEPAGNT